MAADADPDDAEATRGDLGQHGGVEPDGVGGTHRVVAATAADQAGQPGGEPSDDDAGGGADDNGRQHGEAQPVGDRGAEAEGRDEAAEHGAGEPVPRQGVEGPVEQVAGQQGDGEQHEADHADDEIHRHGLPLSSPEPDRVDPPAGRAESAA